MDLNCYNLYTKKKEKNEELPVIHGIFQINI